MEFELGFSRYYDFWCRSMSVLLLATPRLANEKPSRLTTSDPWHSSWGCLTNTLLVNDYSKAIRSNPYARDMKFICSTFGDMFLIRCRDFAFLGSSSNVFKVTLTQQHHWYLPHTTREFLVQTNNMRETFPNKLQAHLVLAIFDVEVWVV